ncbi:MAG TPA: nucleotide exchange factor GrpE [Vicinamibacterales bacterium]
MANQIEDQNPQETSAATDEEMSAGTGQETALEALRRERDALQDRLLRTAAEFDNYRKRVERERRELSEYAGADILTGMLSIVDDLERALQSAGGDADSYRRGVELIHKQMLDLLARRGVKTIEAVGTQFDPNYHEAVIHEASEDHREGEVMAELRRGYTLGDRLLRPAVVKVAKA